MEPLLSEFPRDLALIISQFSAIHLRELVERSDVYMPEYLKTGEGVDLCVNKILEYIEEHRNTPEDKDDHLNNIITLLWSPGKPQPWGRRTYEQFYIALDRDRIVVPWKDW